jgi:hypothetical protein
LEPTVWAYCVSSFSVICFLWLRTTTVYRRRLKSDVRRRRHTLVD